MRVIQRPACIEQWYCPGRIALACATTTRTTRAHALRSCALAEVGHYLLAKSKPRVCACGLWLGPSGSWKGCLKRIPRFSRQHTTTGRRGGWRGPARDLRAGTSLNKSPVIWRLGGLSMFCEAILDGLGAGERGGFLLQILPCGAETHLFSSLQSPGDRCERGKRKPRLGPMPASQPQRLHQSEPRDSQQARGVPGQHDGRSAASTVCHETPQHATIWPFRVQMRGISLFPLIPSSINRKQSNSRKQFLLAISEIGCTY